MMIVTTAFAFLAGILSIAYMAVYTKYAYEMYRHDAANITNRGHAFMVMATAQLIMAIALVVFIN